MTKNKVISEISLVLVLENTFLLVANTFFTKNALIMIIVIVTATTTTTTIITIITITTITIIITTIIIIIITITKNSIGLSLRSREADPKQLTKQRQTDR